MKRHEGCASLTVTAVLVLFAVACGGRAADSGPVTAQQPVTGIDWRVDGLTAGGVARRAPAAAHLRIGEDGGAVGNLGCNWFSARGTVHGDRITFGDLRTTRMACDRDRMDFERALAHTLTAGTLTARTHDAELTLTGDDGDRIQLRRSTAE
ncbi:META domain-containing protein [Streptomyces pluripotens]|uniref:META domain-containing protein n=1 Tax=Streptomyces pluripotens TaxID=1355015 RepID=A0A221P076_9ACTN|nr:MULTISPECIES: META domain-containing protein [Streptomyces]ARP71368.1 META domain-containing protein [Streptomyces pluripotens]ASN25620.1 META domain-containing protein [Streptomyces pluripotens]KIE27760.1 hypothetical protein LK08_06850 [Streptomyces sp. MUSC 125]